MWFILMMFGGLERCGRGNAEVYCDFKLFNKDHQYDEDDGYDYECVIERKR
jgi:hypothetical protein